MAAQVEVLGASPAIHPLDLHHAALVRAGVVTTVDAVALLDRSVKLDGMRQTWRGSRGGTNREVYFMSLEDLSGSIDVVISSDVYRLCRAELVTSGPYIVEGTVELSKTFSDPHLRAARITRLR